MKPKAEVGVFGGSGFYSLFKKARRFEVETPYGFPSGKLSVSKVAGRDVAFLPRHGVHHEFPPHVVPYRANIRAFKDLGVRRIIAPNAVGSLKPEVEPGDIVFCDQFVNFTSGRRDTFYDGPETTHVSTADPYCPEMRRIGIEAAGRIGMKAHRSGTVVVIQGPRFSTRAESRFFSGQGWDVINMTQYPEAVLARELEMCYLNISLVTDYDAGLEGNPTVKPVSHEEVIKVFNQNIARLRELIAEIVKRLPSRRGCECGSALRHARLSA
ncbi:MAG: S-methyl-5'-thioadenosine phosphorylase [Nitrososphaerales archaeon]|nr:S-methyl-5'-thioadenosine phosphorylase [Nitrososphaerales archaeon]